MTNSRSQNTFSIVSGSGTGGKGPGITRAISSSGSEPERSGSKSLWEQYLAALESKPLLTKAITCAILNLLGDVICQKFLEGASSIDVKRSATFTFMGFFFVAPCLHFFYSWLNRVVTATGTTGAIIRVAADQLAFAPVFLSSFFAVLFLVEGKPEQIRPKLEADLFTTVKANWILWVPAQFLNFRFVPPNLNVFAANITALLWNVYMSYASHRTVEAQPQK